MGRPRLAQLTMVVLLAGGVGVADHEESKPTSSSRVLHVPKELQFEREVRVATAESTVRPRTARFLGVLRLPPSASAEVSSPGLAKVEAAQRLPQIGDRVTRGQPLLVVAHLTGGLDRVTLMRERNGLMASVAQRENELAIAKFELQRLRGRAVVTDNVSLLRAERALQTSEAILAAEQDSLALLNATLETSQPAKVMRRTLRSPIDGVVAESFVRHGAVLDEGELVATVVDASQLVVHVQVPQDTLAALQIGAVSGVASVRTTSSSWDLSVALPSDRRASTAARVQAIAPTLSETTHWGTVLLEMKEMPKEFLPGMLVDVDLPAGGTVEGVSAPRSSIVSSGDGWVAFVMSGAETFEIREVDFLEASDGRCLVASGLKSGDPVVVKGVEFLRALSQRE